MLRITSIFLFLFISVALAFSDIINVPADQASIQEGINAATNGDTVLVAENTYMENINFKGKAIIVASHFLVDQDTSHISKTIIDGSQPSDPDSGSVVSFVSGEDTTSILYGFTISGGTGTITAITYFNNEMKIRAGGGIFCFNAGARISYNIINNNHISEYVRSMGGGVAGYPIGTVNFIIIEGNQIINNSVDAFDTAAGGGVDLTCNGRVQNNVIAHNKVSLSEPKIWGGFGGGIECWTDDRPLKVVIDKNRISSNTVSISERADGGGVFLETGDFILTNNIIEHNAAGNAGGGIYGYETNMQIINNTIVMNTALSGSAVGGGVSYRNTTLSKAVIINSIVWGNQAVHNPQIRGRSIEVRYSNIEGKIWDGVGNISKNPAFVDTIEFHLSDSSPCIGRGVGAISLNGASYAAPGTDFAGDPRPNPAGSNPDMGAQENPSGIPGDYILVPEHYSTIQAAIDHADSGEVVLVADGTYLENIKFNGKAITVASHYLTDADTNHISSTVIDGSQPSHPDSGSVVSFVSGEDTTSVLYGFTITGGTGTITKTPYFNTESESRAGGGIFCYNAGARISNNIIKNNHISDYIRSAGGGVAVFPIGSTAYIIIEGNKIINNSTDATDTSGGGGINLTFDARVQNNVIAYNEVRLSEPMIWGGFGGGLDCWTDDTPLHIVIDKNHIRYNTVSGGDRAQGGGINLEFGDFVITNNIIDHNDAGNSGGGIYGYEGNAQMINNTIVMNTALSGSAVGGGVNYIMNTLSKAVIINSIVWGNQAIHNPQLRGLFLEVRHSNIEGDEGEIWDGVGNISADPAFEDTTAFHLSDSSPCISSATESFQVGEDWYYAPATDRYGDDRPNPENTTPDMGAVENENGFVNAIENKDPFSPSNFTLHQNYPNPFNPTTQISFALPKTENVIIEVYNTLGQRIETLLNTQLQAGNHEVEFNAQNLSSGIYFYRIEAGEFQDVKKMILIK